MTQYTDYIRWESRTRVHAGFGMTSGDSFHRGMYTYTEAYPLPNGLPIDYREPGECEWWRKRIAKAKADIERIQAQHRVADLAESITDEQFEVWFSTIKESQLCLQK